MEVASRSHKLSSSCSITHSHVVSSFHIGWIHCLSTFPRTQCDFFPPALTVTPSRERQREVAATGLTAAGSRKRLPVDCSFSIQLVLKSMCACLCLYCKCKCVRGTGAQWADAERRGKVFLCAIFISTGPGNDIFFTFTLVLSHKGQGGDVAATYALNDVFRSSNSALSWKFFFFFFFLMIRLDRESAPQRGLNVQWKECISSSLLPETNSSQAMWANGLSHLK